MKAFFLAYLYMEATFYAAWNTRTATNTGTFFPPV